MYCDSVIYKIYCNDVNITDIYIGSTTHFLRTNKQHKNDCTNINMKAYNNYKYKFIRNNGGWDNWSIILIEKYICNSRLELNTRKRYYVDLLNPALNTNIPIQSKYEWDKINANNIRNYHIQYREKNKDKVQQYYMNTKKKYNCYICNKLISNANMTRHIDTIHNIL